jgi:hypothetical protein
MFTVYADKDIFENIILFKEKTPIWNSIFCNHSEVCLNITEQELEMEQVPGTILFEFIKASGGRLPIALKEFFETIDEDQSTVSQKPRSVFFLNVSKENAEKMRNDYGVMVQSGDDINDTIFTGTYFRELPDQTVLEIGNKTGWAALLNFSHPPSNAMIISDDWLFKNEENSNVIGEVNIISLIDALLPEHLEIDYQILIISQDHNMSKQKCEKIAGNVMSKIKALRKFEIKVEIVFCETLHKRKIFLNYMSITCDKGFAMFKCDDLKTVRSDNDFRYEKIFERTGKEYGDSVYDSDSLLLGKIFKKCNSVSEYIRNKCADPNQRIFGNCNRNKSINNRLLNSI